MDIQILVMNETNGSCLCASLSLSLSFYLCLSCSREDFFRAWKGREDFSGGVKL